MADQPEQRMHPRFYEPTIPVEIAAEREEDSAPAIGLAADISAGGMRIVSASRPTPGRRYTLRFALPGDQRPLHLPAEALHVRPIGEKYACGFAFTEVSSQQRAALVTFLESMH
jgi:c-di-GMP-binding flagellar brake protein YcgR